MPVEHGNNAVAGAVDVDNLAGFRDSVCRGQIDLRAAGIFQRLRRGLLPVPVDGIVLLQRFKKLHLLECDAAAEADGFAGKLLRDGVCRVLRGPEDAHGKAVGGQIFDGGFKIHGNSSCF